MRRELRDAVRSGNDVRRRCGHPWDVADRPRCSGCFSDAPLAWPTAAREALIETARQYGAFITFGELAELVQVRSGILTKSQMRKWIGLILGRVADDCARRQQPPLSALCVRSDQTIGDGYAYVASITDTEMPRDLGHHAAEAGLTCYRSFGAALPSDGGQPQLPPQVAAARAKLRRTAGSRLFFAQPAR